MEYTPEQKYISILLLVGLAAVALLSAWQTEKPFTKACFASSKTYQARPMRGGGEVRSGWAVEGDAFNQCVHRAEVADTAFRKHYPAGRYDLILASTIGCHASCDG